MNDKNKLENIQKDSMWFWNGSKEGRGIKHTIIEVAEDEIVTWSDYRCEKTSGGSSWIGSPSDFLINFKFIGLQKFN